MSDSSTNYGRRRRIISDRRQFAYTLHIPERRNGSDRRKGGDRRQKDRNDGKSTDPKDQGLSTLMMRVMDPSLKISEMLSFAIIISYMSGFRSLFCFPLLNDALHIY